jgi:hypothetical protein
MFYSCSSLARILIPDGVTTISSYALSATALTNIIIPDSTTNIGEGAFEGCANLGGIIIPDSVSSIGGRVFYNCAGMETITIGTNITDIAPAAFFNCTSLISVTIPENVVGIEDDSFSACISMTNILVGGGVTNIGNTAFYGCTSLDSITVASNNTFYTSDDGILFNHDETSLVQYPQNRGGDYIVPDGVLAIDDNAFAYCVNLTAVTLSESVTSLGDGAFFACTSLTNIVMESNITNIGEAVFEECGALNSISFSASVTSVGLWAFGGCDQLASIFFYGNAPAFNGPNLFPGGPATIYYLPGTTGWDTLSVGAPIVPWLPQIQTADGNFGMRTNRFTSNINWASGQTVVVEASADLVDWQPIQTNTLTTGSINFTDPQQTNFPTRFYRVRSP